MHNIFISINNYCLSSEKIRSQRHRCFCQAQRDFSNDIISVQTGKYKSWTYDMDSIHQGKLVVHAITLKTTLK